MGAVCGANNIKKQRNLEKQPMAIGQIENNFAKEEEKEYLTDEEQHQTYDSDSNKDSDSDTDKHSDSMRTDAYLPTRKDSKSLTTTTRNLMKTSSSSSSSSYNDSPDLSPLHIESSVDADFEYASHLDLPEQAPTREDDDCMSFLIVQRCSSPSEYSDSLCSIDDALWRNYSNYFASFAKQDDDLSAEDSSNNWV